MIIGVPKEIIDGECRVAATPDGIKSIRKAGHRVLIERGAGNLAGYRDQEYAKAGAEIVPSSGRVWKGSELVLKVKEPQPSEFGRLRPGMILFCYLHLAAHPRLTRALVRTGVTAIAGETISDSRGGMPVLEPMSEIAGRVAAIVGAFYLSTPQGGRGVLATGAGGSPAAHFVVIGCGTVGSNAARIAAGMGARVTVLDRNEDRLENLRRSISGNVSTLMSSSAHIAESLLSADVIVGAVHVPGAKAPRLITRAMLRKTPRGCVLVDVCIDQGGISETSRRTTHSRPVFVKEGVLHYCVSNMPGAYGHTATDALARAFHPYVLRIADAGVEKALKADPGFAGGLNVFRKRVVCKEVAEAHRLPYTHWWSLLQ